MGKSGPRRNPNSGNSRMLANRTAENLSPAAKALRDRFVEEYFRDFKPSLAWIRAGGSPNTAAREGSQIMREPYVSQRIQEIWEKMEESKLLTKNRIVAGLIQEATREGPGSSHSARVSAWGLLAKSKGMLTDNLNVKGDIKVRGGVMVVPITSPEQWEQFAQGQQRQLKEDVRK